MDAFDQITLDSPEVKPKFRRNNGKGDAFDQIPDMEQSLGEYASRTAGAAATGYASGTPYGMFTNLSNILALGDVLDPEEIEHLRKISEREGIPFDEEKYLEAAQRALGSFPTPSNIARMTEEATGLPITPKDKIQKAVEMGFTASRAQQGTIGQKAVAGTVAPTVKTIAEETGVPEPVADVLGYAAGGFAGSKELPANITKKKPSGLTERQFEGLTEKRKVSPERHEKITQSVENDFKTIADDIISKTPIEETRTSLKSNPDFKNEIAEQFKTVQELAEQIPGEIQTKSVKENLTKTLSKEKGLTASDYEKDYKKLINSYMKEIGEKKTTSAKLVEQFRKNNESLREYYDPSNTKAYNRAKKDALLAYNRSIAEAIEKEFPNTEFSKLFPETNKKWSQINDAESISDFMDGIFDGKINFKEANKFFSNDKLAFPFKRALGEEGFKDFKQLMKDLLSTETPYKMLKVAEKKGYYDLAKDAVAYVIHPKLGLAKTAYESAKSAYKWSTDALLDKPKLTLTWKSGIDNLKKGKFAEAEKDFNKLKSQTEDFQKSEGKRVESLKKFNEKKSIKPTENISKD